MFKTLITTCLLTFSCSCGALHIDNEVKDTTNEVHYKMPQKAYYPNALYGAYCFKDTPDWTTFRECDNFNYTFVLDNSVDIKMYVVRNSGSTIIQLAPTVLSYSKTKDVLTPAYYSTLSFTINDTSYSDSSYSGAITPSEQVRQTVIYFNTPYYVDSNLLKAWNSVYTQSGNTFNVVYSGWFTINNSVSLGVVPFHLYGNFLVDNNLYNQLDKTGTNLYAYFEDYDNGNNYVKPLIATNVVQLTNKAFYIEGVMIPTTIYNQMSDFGVFAYVYQPVSYTFGDMIFSVVDAPVYMLSQLFSFELFGIQFYVAFMGIVTIVLICFVLKKII